MQIKHRLKTSVIISMVLLLALTSFSFLESMEYSAHGKKDYDQSQDINKTQTARQEKITTIHAIT